MKKFDVYRKEVWIWCVSWEFIIFVNLISCKKIKIQWRRHSFTMNAAAGREMYPVFLVRQPRSAVMDDRRSEKDTSVLIHATTCE